MFTTEPIICPLLIGREPQVEAINRYLEHVQTGRSQTLLLCGEAGLGKSRLVAETRLQVTHQGWLAVEGRCFETNQTLPYAPLIDLLHASVITETAEQWLQRGQQLPPELFTLLPSLPGQGIEPPPYEAEPDKYRLFFAVAELLAGLIQADAASPVRPLLLIIEDLHWCDENSLELLLYLIRRLASRPVLFLFTYRGDEIDSTLAQFLSQLDRQRLAAEIFLSPLTRDQIDMMVQAIFNQPRPTRADFLQRLHTFTEGNPFFIEELLKSMVMAGDIFYAEDGIWDRKPLFDLQIPRSVQDAVQNRSRQLTPETRSVLTLAAVVGRRFDFTLLQQLTKTTEDDLLEHIKALLTAQFIIEESADQFAFRHSLTREAIYTSLLGRERRQLHRTIAQTLETMADDTPTRVPPTDLADHFYRGEVWDKVLPYAQQAGERALTFYAPQSAAIYFSQAIEATEKLQQPPSAQLYYQRGQAYATLNTFEDGLADYQRSLDAARAQPDHRLEWQLLLALGDLWATRDYEQSGDYLHQALECVRGLDDPALLAYNLNTIGNWHMNQERPFAALREHQEALAIFQRLSHTAGIAQTLDLLGITAYNCGDVVQGRAYYHEALPLWRQLDDRRGLLHSLTGLSLAVDFDLEVDPIPLTESLPWAEQSVQVARNINWQSGEALALICLGLVQFRQGNYGLALETMQQALFVAEEIEHRGWQADSLHALGALHLDMLALNKARDYLERGLTLAIELNSMIWIRQQISVLALVYISQNELAQAQTLLDQTLPADASMQGLQQRLIWAARIRLALAQGQAETALQWIERLMAATVNLPSYSLQGKTEENMAVPHLSLLHGQALLALGRLDEAEVTLQAGIAAVIPQGRLGLQWRLYAMLAQVYRAKKQHPQADQAVEAAQSVIDTLAAGILDTSLRDNFLQQVAAHLPARTTPSPQMQAKQHFNGLTARERQVAALVAQGQTNRDIAETLILSERTAERHVANIMAKLGVNSRAQIAVWAVEKGLTANS